MRSLLSLLSRRTEPDVPDETPVEAVIARMDLSEALDDMATAIGGDRYNGLNKLDKWQLKNALLETLLPGLPAIVAEVRRVDR